MRNIMWDEAEQKWSVYQPSRDSIGHKANFMCSYIVDFEEYVGSYYKDPEDYWNAIEPYRQWGLDESFRP